MKPLTKLLETSLYVADLRRAVAFYRDILGLRLIEEQEFADGRGAAMAIGQSVLLLFRAEITRRGGTLPAHGASGPSHIAFQIEASELDGWRARLRECSVNIEKEHAFGSNPPSLYFRDPDGNLLEFAVASIWAF